MKSSQKQITGILLAGGMSKRMGQEKGILKIGNHYLYEYPLRIMESLCDEILISTCKNFSLPLSHTMVCDAVSGAGPMGGIYTCIEKSSNDLNIILSYDMPMVNTGLLKYLIQECEAYDLVLPALHQNRPEPLCGIYKKSLTGVLGELIEKKRFAVHGILPLVHSRTILINNRMPFYLPDIFLNINEESDLDRLPLGFGNEN